jgi:hypothetical protein
MATDARGHTIPASTDHPSRAGWVLSPLLSVKDPIPTANTTTRATLITTLGALTPAITASTSNPIYVWRADAGSGRELELTVDGTNWRTVVSGNVSGHAARATAGAVADSTVTNFSWDAPTLAGGMTCASNTTFTVPVAGRYLVTFSLPWAVSASGYRSAWVFKNGSTRVLEDDSAGSSVAGVYVKGSRVLDLAASDTLALQAYQTSGGSLNLGGGTTSFFTIDYVGGVN